jgi:hypothetical protein
MALSSCSTASYALKESTGLDLALKALFKTRLLGNVDQATWTALVGPGIKLRGIPDGQGMWHQPDKRGHVATVTIRRPTVADLTRLSTQPPSVYLPILEAAQPYRDQLADPTDAATGAPALTSTAAPSAPASAWKPTEIHLQVRELIEAAMPDLIRLMAEEGHNLAKAQELTETSNRALARWLGLGTNGGTAAMKVGDLIKEWEVKGGVTLFDVPEDLPIEPVSERSERVERAERPERPERPDHLERPERLTSAA